MRALSRTSLSLALLVLISCSSSPITVGGSSAPTTWFTGKVMGGLSPVVGASVQVYQVGNSSDASAATSLLGQALTTDSTGAFSVPTLSTCNSSMVVYLVATGGAAVTGKTNPNLTMTTMLGVCSSIASGSSFTVNELTTVAMAASMPPYMTSATLVGSSTSDSGSMMTASQLASEYVNPVTGTAPGATIPQGATAPIDLLNMLANGMAACVETAGGVAGDGSACGSFFLLTKSSGGTAPTDTTTALVNTQTNSGVSPTGFFGLVPTGGPFQPQLTVAPSTLKPSLILGALQISPASLDFGNVHPGATSAAQLITLTNTATVVATISASITGPAAADFSQTANCATVPAGGNCYLTVSATPSTTGTRLASLVLNSNVSPLPQQVALTVNGVGTPQLTISPTSLNFVSQNTGVTSAAQSITVKNDGSAVATFSVLLTGTNPGDFSSTNTCGSSIVVNASCTVSVTTTPAVAGTRTATLVINSSDPSAPYNISLTVTTSGVAHLSATPTSLSFGNVNIGSQSTLQSIMVTNTGSGPATLNASLTGAQPADFSFNTSCTSSLPVNANCYYYFSANPTAPGSGSASLSIASNDPGSPLNIPLSTTGITPSGSAAVLSTSTLSFTVVGTLQDVTLTNTGTSAFAITSITETNGPGFNPGVPNFTIEGNTCGSSLSAGLSCTITLMTHTLRYTAPNGGFYVPSTYTGTLTIVDAVGTQTVALTSTNTAGFDVEAGNASEAYGQFGSAGLGGAAGLVIPTMQVGYTNLLNEVEASFEIGGANSSEFSTAMPGCDLAPSVSSNPCPIGMSFIPAAAGLRTARLYFDNTQQYIPLSGTGVASSIQPSTNISHLARASGSQTVGITNTGSSSVTLSPTVIELYLPQYQPSIYISASTCTGTLAPAASCTITVATPSSSALSPAEDVAQLNLNPSSGPPIGVLLTSY